MSFHENAQREGRLDKKGKPAGAVTNKDCDDPEEMMAEKNVNEALNIFGVFFAVFIIWYVYIQ